MGPPNLADAACKAPFTAWQRRPGSRMPSLARPSVKSITARVRPSDFLASQKGQDASADASSTSIALRAPPERLVVAPGRTCLTTPSAFALPSASMRESGNSTFTMLSKVTSEILSFALRPARVTSSSKVCRMRRIFSPCIEPDLSMHATRSSGARSTSFGAVGALIDSIARMDCASVLETDTLSAEIERAHGEAAVSAAPALEDGVRVGCTTVASATGTPSGMLSNCAVLLRRGRAKRLPI